MLRFPLHTPVLLITSGGKYIGRITYAGEDVIKVVDVIERILTPEGDYFYTDNELSGELHFNRNHITAFKPLDCSELFVNEQLYTQQINTDYNDILAQSNRTQFRLIKKISKNDLGELQNDKKNDT